MTESKLYNRLWNVLISRVSFELYTLPDCERCKEVKKFLDERGIKYKEINATYYTEGRKNVNEHYMYSKNGGGYKIEKGKDGDFVFPILKWGGFSQGPEDISELFKSLKTI